MIVRLSAEAEDDLERIGDYIARENPQRALTFIGALRAKCMDLAFLPDRFPLLAGYERDGIRRRVHGNYLIFYRVEPDRVVVIHILHGARDYLAILFPG